MEDYDPNAIKKGTVTGIHIPLEVSHTRPKKLYLYKVPDILSGDFAGKGILNIEKRPAPPIEDNLEILASSNQATTGQNNDSIEYSLEANFNTVYSNELPSKKDTFGIIINQPRILSI